jgi:hypothetical protein
MGGTRVTKKWRKWEKLGVELTHGEYSFGWGSGKVKRRRK